MTRQRVTYLTSADVEELVEATRWRLVHVRHRPAKAVVVQAVIDKLLALRRQGNGRVWIISD